MPAAKMSVIRLSRILHRNIRTALASGMKLVSGSFGNDKKTCCAMSAAGFYPFADKPSKERLADLWHQQQGLARKNFWAVIDGFDEINGFGSFYSKEERAYEFYKLGQRLRKKFLRE